jgi:soluble lytic murein transglycosylase
MNQLPVRKWRHRGLTCAVTLIFLAAIAGLLVACSPNKDVSIDARAADIVVNATASPAPTATLLPTSTPTPTPTPTPSPSELITAAQKARFYGDDIQSAAYYSRALGILDQTHSELALRARFDMGVAQLEAGNTHGAMEAFTAIVSDAVSSTVTSDARVRLGYAAAVSGDYPGAIAQYNAAVAGGSVISPYLELWIGDAYIAANNPVSAVVPYAIAVREATGSVQTILRREKLALSLSLSGQLPAALSNLEANFREAQYAVTRARNEVQAAQVMLAMGQKEAAYQRWRDITLKYPELPAAYSALVELDKVGQPVDDLQRGIIDYHAGANAAAQRALKRAITTGLRMTEVRYWAALNYADMGNPADAYRNLNEIIAEGPGSSRYGDALIEKGSLQASAGDNDNAAQTYRLLASTAPGDPMAPVALQRIGLFYEHDGLLEQAAQTHLAAATGYPNDAGAPEALLRGAVIQYRLGKYPDAASTLNSLLSAYPSAQEAKLAQVWLGKTQIAMGQVVTGQTTLAALALRSPDTYEGTRAAEMAADSMRVPLSKPFGKTITFTQEAEARDQLEAEKWLRLRLNISETVEIRTLTTTTRSDVRFQKGSQLWRLGFQAEAVEEYAALRDYYSKDTLTLYALAVYLRDIGAYRQSIGTAVALMQATGVGSVNELPRFIARLQYPIYYPDLISAQASEFALDPLLVAGLIRQESLFESFAASDAFAYGLMQVVPATGKEINAALGWPPDYSERDLTRPYVSVRFGAYYLARQRDALKGDLYAALAAYNGGPGMALRWRNRSGGDPDAFFLTVPLDGAGYRETQLYLRTVTTNYAIYHRLYAGD